MKLYETGIVHLRRARHDEMMTKIFLSENYREMLDFSLIFHDLTVDLGPKNQNFNLTLKLKLKSVNSVHKADEYISTLSAPTFFAVLGELKTLKTSSL